MKGLLKAAYAQKPLASFIVFAAIATSCGVGEGSGVVNADDPPDAAVADEIEVDEISVGDCLNLPEDDKFDEVDMIDCSDEHDVEVFALVDLREISPEFELFTDYPDDQELYDVAVRACYDRFEEYVGVPYEDSVLFMDVFTPTISSWAIFSDRTVNCLVYEVDADQTELVKSTRSLRDARR